MTDQEKIKAYAKNHSRKETISYFSNGEGSYEISMGLSLHLKAIGQYWDEAQEVAEATDETPATETETTEPGITLKMYADNGKAIWEYSGPAEDGSQMNCKGEIKNREFAVKLAQRATKRSHENKCAVDFRHGKSTGMDEFLREQFTAICLSPAALEAVEAEIATAYRPALFGLEGR